MISDGQIAQLCGHWAEQGVAGADWPALAAQVRTLAALRSDSEDPAQLAPLVDQLAALHARAKEALAAAVTQPSEPVETDP